MKGNCQFAQLGKKDWTETEITPPPLFFHRGDIICCCFANCAATNTIESENGAALRKLPACDGPEWKYFCPTEDNKNLIYQHFITSRMDRLQLTWLCTASSCITVPRLTPPAPAPINNLQLLTWSFVSYRSLEQPHQINYPKKKKNFLDLQKNKHI